MVCVKGGPVKDAIFVKVVHDVPWRRESWRLCFAIDLLALVINPVDQGLRMALRTDLFHVDLGLKVVRTMGRNCVGEVPAEPVRRIVGNLEAVDAAHVARCAGWHKHVTSRKVRGSASSLSRLR